MDKSIRLIYCIIGSIILSFISLPNFYDAIISIPIIGYYLAQLTYYVSSIGIALTIYFSFLLIKENYK